MLLPMIGAVSALLPAEGWSAPDDDAHRYWRILLVSSGNGFMSASEIEMRETVGGANVISTGTFTASGSHGSFPLTNSQDGNSATFWVTAAGGNNGWVKVDFGVGITKKIHEISWRSRQDSSGVTEAMRFGRVQWSDDNSAWTTSWTLMWPRVTLTNEAARVSAKPLDFTANKHAYWRVDMDAPNDGGTNNTGFAELKFIDVIGSDIDQATGGGPWAGNFVSSQFPELAFDDNTTTYWSSSAGGQATWLGYMFPNSVRVREVAIKARPTSFTDAPENFSVEFSDDGEVWFNRWNVTGASGWTAGEERFFPRP